MWLYFCYGIVFLHVVNTTLVRRDTKHGNDHAKENEAIFAGVIKNISRVNNVLQKLINNYEQLQKIYESQENIDNVDSDPEIDEVFKSKKEKVKRSKSHKTTKKPAGSYYPATEMIWYDEHDNKNSESSESTTKEEEEERKPKVIKQANKKLTTQQQTDTKSDETTSSSSEEVVKENYLKQPNEPAVVIADEGKLKKSEIIFIDNHRPSIKQKKERHKVLPESDSSPPSKTRYSKISQHQPNVQPQTKMKKHSDILEPKVTLERTNKVKKVVQSEKFSPLSIWDEIMNNKPIQLETHNEVIFENVQPDNHDTNSLQLRSGYGKAAVVVVTSEKKDGERGKDLELIEDEESVNETLKANVLREAYGDACMKLVLRKCHKACKATSKSVCHRYKCKSNMKEKFKEYSKTGCLKEFRGNGNNKDLEMRGNQRNKYGQSDFVDMTREGYMQACLPHMGSQLGVDSIIEGKTITLRNETPTFSVNPLDKNFKPVNENLNILRDRFERACKKVSYKKCINACNYAYTKSCEAYTCVKGKKKAFKKECKKQCRMQYSLSKASSSGSSGSSGSDSSDSDISDSDKDDSDDN